MKHSIAMMRGARRTARIALVLLVSLCADSASAAGSDLELKVKSAFLYNFARFVIWPAQKFANASSPFQVCVLEPDPFGAILDDTLRGKLVDKHPIVVSRSSNIEELKSCHIVYAAATEPTSVEGAFASLAGAGVMTVHESDRPLSAGVVRFFLDERKVRFEINATAAAREKLQLSPKLQSLAIIVQK